MIYKFHKDGTKPVEDEIFVFGSNLAGRHGAGAALAAYSLYGAEYGNGQGFQGDSYAIPTKDNNIKTLDLKTISKWINIFKLEAFHNTDAKFFLTRIGCGLAGYKDEDIAPLFIKSPMNINFPEEWRSTILWYKL